MNKAHKYCPLCGGYNVTAGATQTMPYGEYEGYVACRACDLVVKNYAKDVTAAINGALNKWNARKAWVKDEMVQLE